MKKIEKLIATMRQLDAILSVAGANGYSPAYEKPFKRIFWCCGWCVYNKKGEIEWLEKSYPNISNACHINIVDMPYLAGLTNNSSK